MFIIKLIIFLPFVAAAGYALLNIWAMADTDAFIIAIAVIVLLAIGSTIVPA